ncbi:MAG: hypothetical protein GXO36_05995 [Chloroflexi bacterium]|nr:hypothetical protein [Chloroflexota bacterium]
MNASARARWPLLAGAILGFTFLLGMAWVNFEARMFYPADMFTPGRKRSRLRSLRCPLVVARDETAVIRFTLSNPLPRPIRRIARITVAHKHVLLVDQERIIIDLGPHEKQTIQRAIPPSQGVYGGWMLLVSVYVARTPPLDPSLNDCGTLVLPIQGVPGWVIVLLWNGLALGLMLWGWRRIDPDTRGFATLLVGMYLVGLIALVLFRGWVVAASVAALALFAMLLQGLQRLEGGNSIT